MELGQMLPIWSIVPFVGMLPSIAIFPLVKPDWWEKHQLLVALAWSLVFLVPFALSFGPEVTAEHLAETLIGDYVPFIVLLLGLYVVAGGIHIGGSIPGTTRNNVIILLVGTFLASWIGTTGALSSFLDNLPTYVVFLTTAGALPTDALGAVETTVGLVDPSILLAVSAGAVFMGAITYIGNAPNFMVKNIAEGVGVKMPSFFGYIG